MRQDRQTNRDYVCRTAHDEARRSDDLKWLAGAHTSGLALSRFSFSSKQPRTLQSPTFSSVPSNIFIWPYNAQIALLPERASRMGTRKHSRLHVQVNDHLIADRATTSSAWTIRVDGGIVVYVGVGRKRLLSF